MSGWRKIERSLRPWAIPNLTQLLIAGQIAVFVLVLFKKEFSSILLLDPTAILAGQWWRMFTFVFVPASTSPLYLLYILMLLPLFGNALNAHLGNVRYNLFILTSILSSIGTALILMQFGQTGEPFHNGFIYGSIFLAFAWLYPEFEIMAMMVLPIKIKWLALISVFVYFMEFSKGLSNLASGGWITCLMILAANLNLLIFFGRDLYNYLLSGPRRKALRSMVPPEKNKPRHVCVVCGANNLTHPQCDFRYCPDCEGTPAYCEQHLRGHIHIVKESSPSKSPL